MALKIFYCYAHEDQAFRNELEKHLSPLKQSGGIIDWCDRKIKPGTNRRLVLKIFSRLSVGVNHMESMWLSALMGLSVLET
jgi:hypothetical protein